MSYAQPPMQRQSSEYKELKVLSNATSDDKESELQNEGLSFEGSQK